MLDENFFIWSSTENRKKLDGSSSFEILFDFLGEFWIASVDFFVEFTVALVDVSDIFIFVMNATSVEIFPLKWKLWSLTELGCFDFA